MADSVTHSPHTHNTTTQHYLKIHTPLITEQTSFNQTFSYLFHMPIFLSVNQKPKNPLPKNQHTLEPNQKTPTSTPTTTPTNHKNPRQRSNKNRTQLHGRLQNVGQPVHQRERMPVVSVPERRPLSRSQSTEEVRMPVSGRLHRPPLRTGAAGLRRADAVP